jgi:hypothetical protein
MARKKTEKKTAPVETDKLMVSRRLPRSLWKRVQDHVNTIQPRTTDTAIMELALEEYLARNEKK